MPECAVANDSTESVRTATRPPEFRVVLDAIQGVEGWLTDDQAYRLWDRARALRAGDRIVEIGSFRGRSTIVLALGAPPEVEIVAIDPHVGSDRGPQEITGDIVVGNDDHSVFLANLERAGVGGRVRHVRKFSHEALDDVPDAISVLFIDGAHRYAPARADIVEWGAKVDSAGTMLIHDSFSSVGVTLAILRELVVGSAFRYLGRSRSLTEYRRESLWGRERGDNALRQIAQLPWFLRNLAFKVLITARQRAFADRLGNTQEWPY